MLKATFVSHRFEVSEITSTDMKEKLLPDALLKNFNLGLTFSTNQ